jgi:hypothetical protein
VRNGIFSFSEKRRFVLIHIDFRGSGHGGLASYFCWIFVIEK